MAVLAVEATAAITADSVYNQDKWYLPSSLIRKRTDLGTPFVGPATVAVARPVETVTAAPTGYPCAVDWSPDINWVFFSDAASAAITRRIIFYEHNKALSTMSFRGVINIKFPMLVGVKTVQGFRVTYDKYTVGTAQCVNADSKVGGLNTLWTTNKLTYGSRIGFGDSIPWKIPADHWHVITNIIGDTKIAISPKASSAYPIGPYVIEDVRAYHYLTNATTSNGGLFVSKGIEYGMFSSVGDSVPQYNYAGDTLDSVARQDIRRRTYWLLAPTKIEAFPALAQIGNSADSRGAGMGIEDKTSWTAQNVYTINAITTSGYRAYKYNVRSTILCGKIGADSRNSYLLQTGNLVMTAGTVLQGNNGRLASTNHGPGKGVNSLYFLTTGSNGFIIRAATSLITSGNTAWVSDYMKEMPPGSTNTYAATSLLTQIDYSSVLDRFVVNSSGAAGVRSYVTQYRTDGGQMDHIFLVDDKQIDQGVASTEVAPHPSILILGKPSWTEDGFLYMSGVGTTAITNIVYVIPIGADWSYSVYTGNRLISPRLLTPNCDHFNRVYVVRDRIIGSDILGMPADPFRLWYRTVGISDNSGPWTLVAEPNDLSGIDEESQIQFAFDFKCISQLCIPSRVFLVGATYTDLSTDAHYQPSIGMSDKTYKRFAWRFSTAFGTAVPTLRVRLYEAISSTLLLSDYTNTSTYGAWEKSTNNGLTWGSYNTTDKASDSIYIRYTPTTLADNIKVRAVLTQ